MTQNEKLTLQWVKETINQQNNLLMTTEVLQTLKPKKLKRVKNKLEKRGILTFTDYQSPSVIFVKKSDPRLSSFSKNGYTVGYWTSHENNIVLLPLTPNN